MGGYGSGRRKAHSITSECLPLDTSFLLSHRMLTGNLKQSSDLAFTSSSRDIKGKVTTTHHTLSCIVERYSGEGGLFSRWDAAGHITLHYGIKQGEQTKICNRDIPLVVTHPYYGGVRWWYLAPCCGRRVRVLYLPTYGSLDSYLPACRQCLELNYASQRQSYIERHKTYERHLLMNYGYAWAEIEYHCLREHYLKITPEIEYLRQCSILDMRMRMLRHLMAFARIMLRTHMHTLRSIKSEEDRLIFLTHIAKAHGERYAIDLVRMVGISIQMERDAHEASSEVFDQAYEQLTGVIAQDLQSDEEAAILNTRLTSEDVVLNGKINLPYLLTPSQVMLCKYV